MYSQFFKRLIDFLVSLCAIIALLPIFAILVIAGTIAMRGNPFFFQKRPGHEERIFSLIKFRTMSNAKDDSGNFLPNELRLNKYGEFLRSTSLDELPELFNILIGDMSIVGPRPLLPEYLPYYSEEEHHRHDVRPGLTGLAQVNGRNAIESWEERFQFDLHYVNNCTLLTDIIIVFKTISKVVKRTGIASGSNSKLVGRLDDIRREDKEKSK